MSESGPSWNVIFTRQAEMALHRLSRQALQGIDQAILTLAENPRPPESQQLVGDDNLYRLFVGEWRITYAVEEDRLTILILEIAPKQRPERYRLGEETDQALWLEEMVDSGQESRAKMEERLRASLLFYAFQAFRDRVEFSDLAKDFDQEQASALIFDLSPLTRKKLRKLKEDLERTLAELADEELRERQSNPERIRVLIVDDIPETRENLRKLLFFESDIEVVGAATNGGEAIQMAVERQPDVVLMDLLMPGLDGLEATEWILQQAPSTRIIMMSVQGEADVFRRAMMAGAREFLVKPFSRDELVSSIRRVHQPKRIGWARHEDILRAIQSTPIDETPGKILEFTKFIKGKKDLDSEQINAGWNEFTKLGDHVEISLSVVDLSESLSFYEKLGLKKVDGDETPYPWAVVSDDTLHIGLHQHSFPSPTLSYFASYTPDVLNALQEFSISLDHVQKISNTTHMHDGEVVKREDKIAADFQAIEGQRVFLASKEREVKPNLKRKFFSRCDKFGELSFKTEDVNAAVTYWEKLGFKQVVRNNKPYPSAVISDGLIRLGFHQTCNFSKPTLTYFAPDMAQRLEHLREQGIEFISEQKDAKGQCVGAMIESPDGQPFFLFAGEITT